MTRWAILTGEYPPQPGGVSDYTQLVARGLVEAGDSVRVFAPPAPASIVPQDSDVSVHRLPGRFGPRSLVELDQLLSRERPDRVLVQYVPHAYGWKAMNLPFVMWLTVRAPRIAPVWVMFHEVAFPFSWQPPTHAVLGSVTRMMARAIAATAERVFVSIPAWSNVLGRLWPRMKPPVWLPVPCNVSTVVDSPTVEAIRARFGRADFLVGHFGTFGKIITDLLAPVIADLLRLVPGAIVFLVGRGSERFREEFAAAHPELADRLTATGTLPPEAVSAHLRACDLLVQPFPDGMSARRTSAMAGLANGLPVITNLGPLSEPVWATSGIARVSTPDDPMAFARCAAALLANPNERAELGRRGAALYRETFALEHTIAKLRDTP